MEEPKHTDLRPIVALIRRSVRNFGKELKCPICLCLIRNAKSVPCACKLTVRSVGRVVYVVCQYCALCIENALVHDSRCPSCHVPTYRRALVSNPVADGLALVFVELEKLVFFATKDPLVMAGNTFAVQRAEKEAKAAADLFTSACKASWDGTRRGEPVIPVDFPGPSPMTLLGPTTPGVDKQQVVLECSEEDVPLTEEGEGISLAFVRRRGEEEEESEDEEVEESMEPDISLPLPRRRGVQVHASEEYVEETVLERIHSEVKINVGMKVNESPLKPSSMELGRKMKSPSRMFVESSPVKHKDESSLKEAMETEEKLLLLQGRDDEATVDLHGYSPSPRMKRERSSPSSASKRRRREEFSPPLMATPSTQDMHVIQERMKSLKEQLRALEKESDDPSFMPPPSRMLRRRSTETFKPVITGSLLSKESMIQLDRLQQCFDCEVVSKFSDRVTHVVMPTDEEGLVGGRTIKYISGLLKGLWIVQEEWISSSLQAGRLLASASYLVQGDACGKKSVQCARLRKESGEPKLFQGMRFVMADTREYTKLSKVQVCGLCILGGGKVLRSVSSGGKELRILTGDGETTGKSLPKVLKGHVPIVASWIVDCVSCQKLLDLTEYGSM